jgi:protein gp37
MYKRFKWDETIRFDASVFNGMETLAKKGIKDKRVFVGSTMELFGKWVEDKWMKEILWLCSCYPQFTFIFLTKRPVGLRKWSPFPKNCWVGVSTTGSYSNSYLEDNFRDIQAKVKFMSIEPMLDYTPLDLRWVNWVIVGQQTPPKQSTMPQLSWVLNTVDAADKLRMPVFLKDNLLTMITRWSETNSCGKMETRVLNTLYDGDNLRQEHPNTNL